MAVSAIFLANAVIRYMNKYVVNDIRYMNKKLKAIANGKLDETVDIQDSVEFAELSQYINAMVKSLLDNNIKMSYVLSKTNLYIGVYEYNKHMEKVRFTDYIPKIFSLDAEEMERLSSDIGEFRKFIDKIHEHPLPDETGVYKVGEQYVRLEEIGDEDEHFGIAIDATAEIVRRRKIEAERDIDLLTGLYNRRGLDTQLTELFGSPEKLGYCGMVMIDADGLKKINDTYGHDMGDLYLKKIASLLYGFDPKHSIAARLGGDEFVLFLYGYDNREALPDTIEALTDLQKHSSVQFAENLEVPLRFSFGYSLAEDEADCQRLLKEADRKMYIDKIERKKMQKNS